VSAQYNERTDEFAAGDFDTEKWTVGVYHDVNSNLKLVAEYTDLEDDNGDIADIFSIGGFVFF
jgi:limonene-1,2-epoxide hydrolase